MIHIKRGERRSEIKIVRYQFSGGVGDTPPETSSAVDMLSPAKRIALGWVSKHVR